MDFDYRPADLLIATAVKQEFEAVRKVLHSAIPEPRESFDAVIGTLHGTTVRLIRTGMGEQRSSGACYEALTQSTGQLLLLGLCGGLAANLATGHLAIGSGSACEGGTEPITSDRNLQLHAMKAAQEASLSALRGVIVTVSQLAESPAEKRRLSVHIAGSIAVDMETRASAMVAHQLGVPWVSVRAVSDTCSESLPVRFGDFVSPATGEVDPKRLALYTASHPWKTAALAKLGKNAGVATRNLGRFVEAYVRLMAQGEPDPFA